MKYDYHIAMIKEKTESNSFGVLKTIVVLLLILLQASILVFTNLYLLNLFRWYFAYSMFLTLIACVHVLSSDYHGQSKATWILFLVISLGFGYVVYIMSDKHILFANSRKKYNKIFNNIRGIQGQNNINNKINLNKEVCLNCNYLYNSGWFKSHFSSKTMYFNSGSSFFQDVLKEIESAKEFIFLEFYIISDGVLLNKMFDILKNKVEKGVDVRIIHDDMGCHGRLKRKTKKLILDSGIKLIEFNRLVPVFNIALNLRDHRKIIVIDGKTAYTGGANLADEYIDEKRPHGYWKDSGIKIEGQATDNFTISFLVQWQFLTNESVNYQKFINKSQNYVVNNVVVPFVSGPHYNFSISRDIYINIISNSVKYLYIMTPYFIPDETIINLILNKAQSGVDVRIVLPEIADKKFVYIVSRNNAEKLLKSGVKIFVMKNSFVHSKVIVNEHECVVGSINLDLRSFYQLFESAVYTSQESTLDDVKKDFSEVFKLSLQITDENKRRNSFIYRILAGLFNLISPFM